MPSYQETIDSLRRLLQTPWEPETTARNLRLINTARQRRGELQPWMSDVEKVLQNLGDRSSLSA